MVWRFLLDIALSDAKQLLVGCREQFGKKRYRVRLKVSHSFKTAKWKKKYVVVLKCKKMFLLEKIGKNV